MTNDEFVSLLAAPSFPLQSEYCSAARLAAPLDFSLYQTCAGADICQSATRLDSACGIESLSVILKLDCPRACRLTGNDEPDVSRARMMTGVADGLLQDPIDLNLLGRRQPQSLFDGVTAHKFVFEPAFGRHVRNRILKRPFQCGRKP